MQQEVVLIQPGWYADVVQQEIPLSPEVKGILLRKLPCRIEQTCTDLAHFLGADMANAVPARRYEFALGRLAVGSLLSSIGIPVTWAAVEDRRPVWPFGAVGSISHSTELIAAAVALSTRVTSVGVDIENLKPSGDALNAIGSICFTAQERGRLSKATHGLVIGFSIKEALFKCLNPLARVFFDFLDVEIVALYERQMRARLVLHRDLGARFRGGSRFEASFRFIEDHVWATVILPAKSIDKSPPLVR